MLECVLNLSEGRDHDRLHALGQAAGDDLLDLHSDPHHHRSVLTLVGEAAPRAVASLALDLLDLRQHDGVHPRLGVIDVVPFVALDGSTPEDAVRARDAFATWLAEEHGVPCFLYGDERSLPDVRRHAFRSLSPDRGPGDPHPRAGATAVGARPPLIAYNVWLVEPDLELARRTAAVVRGDGIRSLGLVVGARSQVSMNLIEPSRVGPDAAYDRVRRAAATTGATVAGAELVGLLPNVALLAVDERRWPRLDLRADRTIEARLAARAG